MKKTLLTSSPTVSTRCHDSEIDKINADLARDEAYTELLQSLTEDTIEMMEEDDRLCEKKTSA